MSNLVINTWVGSLMSFLPFSMIQTLLDLQIFKFILFFDLVLKLPKLDTPVWQTGQSSFSSLAKFGHQHHPQTDGQTERVNQILEDMIRACAL
jgi:hypothetical protein